MFIRLMDHGVINFMPTLHPPPPRKATVKVQPSGSVNKAAKKLTERCHVIYRWPLLNIMETMGGGREREKPEDFFCLFHSM